MKSLINSGFSTSRFLAVVFISMLLMLLNSNAVRASGDNSGNPWALPGNIDQSGGSMGQRPWGALPPNMKGNSDSREKKYPRGHVVPPRPYYPPYGGYGRGAYGSDPYMDSTYGHSFSPYYGGNPYGTGYGYPGTGFFPGSGYFPGTWGGYPGPGW